MSYLWRRDALVSPSRCIRTLQHRFNPMHSKEIGKLMSNVKLHPSIIIYSVWDKDDADVIVNGDVVYSGPEWAGHASDVSTVLWQLELTPPVKARRTPRGQDMLWQ